MAAVIRAGQIERAQPHSERKEVEIGSLLTDFVKDCIHPLAGDAGYQVKVEVDKPIIKYLKLLKGSRRIDLFVKPGVIYAYYLIDANVVSLHGKAYERRVDLTSPESSLRAILGDFDQIERELKGHDRFELSRGLAQRLEGRSQGLVGG